MDKSMEEKTMEKECCFDEEYVQIVREVRQSNHEFELYLVDEFLTGGEKETYFQQMNADNEKTFEPPKENKYSDSDSQARYAEWWNLTQKALAATKRMEKYALMERYKAKHSEEIKQEAKKAEEMQNNMHTE